jgi:hypothetical protein
MRRANLVLFLSIIGIMVFVSSTFGQEALTPTPIPGVSPAEKKADSPAKEKWEFEITRTSGWQASMEM